MRPVASHERQKRWALPNTDHLYRKQTVSQELAALIRPWPAPGQLEPPANNPVFSALSQARHNLQLISQRQSKSPLELKTASDFGGGGNDLVAHSSSRIRTGAGREVTNPTTMVRARSSMTLSAHTQLLY